VDTQAKNVQATGRPLLAPEQIVANISGHLRHERFHWMKTVTRLDDPADREIHRRVSPVHDRFRRWQEQEPAQEEDEAQRGPISRATGRDLPMPRDASQPRKRRDHESKSRQHYSRKIEPAGF